MSTESHCINVWPLLCGLTVVTDGDPRGDDYTVGTPSDDELLKAVTRLIDGNIDTLEEYLAEIMAENKERLAWRLSA